ETKANLRRDHMQSFFDAGVRSIQPGIESLHDEILRLLAKGNKAWMNVQLLKWAAELAMDISWVFLVDVPGQRDAWYIEMLTWLTFVSHLPPPSFAVPIQFMRFSRVADRHRLEGDAARLYAACDEAVDRGALRERLAIDRFEELVAGLLADKILLDIGGRLLALAVDTARPRPEEAPNPGGRI